MARLASYRDQYRSTGYCKILGGVSAGSNTGGIATRTANRAERSAKMSGIIDRILTK